MSGQHPVQLDPLLVGTLAIALLAGHPVWAGPKAADSSKPPPLTAEQKERLKERDRCAEGTTRLRREGKTAEAIATAEKMLAIEREVFGKVQEDVAGSLEQLSEMYLECEQFAKARAARQEVLAIRVQFHGEAHYSVTNARLSLADVNLWERLGAEDRACLRETTALMEQVFELAGQGKWREALPLARKVLAIRKKVLGDNHRDTAKALYNLGVLLDNQGEYAAARPYHEQALVIRRKMLGDNHPDTADSFNGLGILLDNQGDYAAARTYYEQALVIRRKVLGDNHPDTAGSLNNLARLLRAQGDYAAARSYYEQALTILEKVRGDNQPQTAAALNNLGELLYVQGDYAGARAYYEQALTIRKKILGDNHPDTAASLGSLGALLHAQGDYAAARHYYEQALAIHKKVLGDNHPDTAASLNNLGALLQDQGDNAAARPYYEQVLAIDKRILGDNHPHTAASLMNLGMLLHHQGDSAAARHYNEQALAIYKKVLGDNHPDTAKALNNLGALLQDQGDYAAARPYYEQALAILKRVRGHNHPDTATSLNNLGILLHDQGDYQGARPYYEQALAIRKKVLGDNHPDTATSLDSLGVLLHSQEDYAAATTCYQQAFVVQRKLARELLGSLSEVEALAYIDTTQDGRDPLLSVLRHLPESSPEQAYAPVWETRALASRAIARRRLPPGVDRKTQELWQQLRDKRGQLARLTLAVVPPDQAQKRQEWLAELSAEKEELERRLAAASVGFRQQQEVECAGFDKLVARLSPNTAVLDIVEITLFEPPEGGKGELKRTLHYEAFVLRGGEQVESRVAWVHLGPAQPINEAAERWRLELTGHGLEAERVHQDEVAEEAPGQSLRRLVWDKIEPHLHGCTAVIIIPDSALTRIPWAALPGKRPGSYLLEDYALGTASSGQQLYELLLRPAPQGDQALVAGGIRYDAAPPGDSLAAHRGPALDLKKRPLWHYLRGSLSEARSIKALCPKPERVELLEADQATEAALRQTLPRARYVHLATHGFFADARFRSAFQHDVSHEKLQRFGFAMSGRRSTATGRNPLTLSGVVLAGANEPQAVNAEGAPVGDDGILTAEEVAELDLGNTELVVLSACETGLGDVAGGEGVFGLQRGFGLAGARATVASLWKVDDAATQALMTAFYDNLWRKKLPRLEALRQAQLRLLNRPVGRSRPRGPGEVLPEPEAGTPARTDPRLWAAWVLSGDPGDLSDVQAVSPPTTVPAVEPILVFPSSEPGWRVWLPEGVGGLVALVVLACVAWTVRRRLRRQP
jgi:tetratricopeptide (TPR) repeat protein/CHAT domain-containing protein